MILSAMILLESYADRKEESVHFANRDGLSEKVFMKLTPPDSAINVKNAKSISTILPALFFRTSPTSQSLDFVPLLHGIESVQ